MLDVGASAPRRALKDCYVDDGHPLEEVTLSSESGVAADLQVCE